jgi:hypothetical protein
VKYVSTAAGEPLSTPIKFGRKPLFAIALWIKEELASGEVWLSWIVRRDIILGFS